jgi:hypothetical protein
VNPRSEDNGWNKSKANAMAAYIDFQDNIWTQNSVCFYAINKVVRASIVDQMSYSDFSM